MVRPDLYGLLIPPIRPISADFSPVISPVDSPIPAYSIQQCSVQEPLQDLAVSVISSSEQTSSSSYMQSRLDVSSEALNGAFDKSSGKQHRTFPNLKANLIKKLKVPV